MGKPSGLVVSCALLWALGTGCSSSDDAQGSGDGESGLPRFEGFDGSNGSLADGAGGGDSTGSGAEDSGGGGAGDDGSTDAAEESEAGGEDGSEDAATGFEYPCEPGTLQSCTTACGTSGVQKCLKDWGACTPLAEKCDNCIDDDCNGFIDESCPGDPGCEPPEVECPTAVITAEPASAADVGSTVSLSANASFAPDGTVAAWKWEVSAPAGSTSLFSPSDDVKAPTFLIDVAGQFVFTLHVWDLEGMESCAPAIAVIEGKPFPPAEPEIGCADGQREGFLDMNAYPQVAACAGAWVQPGITPGSVQPTCNRQGGDDGAHPDGGQCSSADLCANGWHVCNGWQELAAKSPSGCAGAVPEGAPSKSHFFALRQPSANHIECGAEGAGFNDVFGCGNLGVGIPPEKGCGPLDRALASTQPDKCGFNEAEPPLGPWECKGGPGSDIKEGQFVTKKGCPGGACSYDGKPVGSSDRGGVICCRGL